MDRTFGKTDGEEEKSYRTGRKTACRRSFEGHDRGSHRLRKGGEGSHTTTAVVLAEA